MQKGMEIAISTECGCQAMEYNLTSHVVFAASNSGQTKQVIQLLQKLEAENHRHLFGLTAHPQPTMHEAVGTCYVLNCGKENACAATKSVIEQALFYHSLLANIEGDCCVLTNQPLASEHARRVLEMPIDPGIIERIARASIIYFAGRNNGVAEELTLKTNEITRIKSDYLEGTYAVHGIEEVMDPDAVVIVVDPFETEERKFREVLINGVGLEVIAIASRATSFPTIQIPSVAGFDPYLQLMAGWNLLVEVGVANQVNLDKPVRARKIGNELIG